MAKGTCCDCGGKCSPAALRCKPCASRERWRIARERGLAGPGSGRGHALGCGYEPVACASCGTLFQRSAGRRMYCSLACRDAGKAVTKPCAQCGKEFTVLRSVAARYTVCSYECRLARGGETRYCARCGDPFRVGYGQHRGAYCSEECRRPALIATCPECGLQFRTRPSYAATGRRYCSARCYRASNAETGIEQRVRLELQRLRLDARPQVQIGRWTVDFLVGDLVIEADGKYWHRKRPGADERKTTGLMARGLHVWRLGDDEINADHFPQALEQRVLEHECDHGWLPRIASTPLLA